MQRLGGKFQDGFLSAAVSAGFSSAGLFGSPGTGGLTGTLTRTAAAGIVGGTASVIGGGKFANGAYTAALQHLLNFELPANAEREKSIADSQRLEGRIDKSLEMNTGQLPDFSDSDLTIVMKEYKHTLQERNPGFFGWAYDTFGKADTIFHDKYSGINFNFINTSNNPLLPKSGIYSGSDINYVAVGINFAAANAAQTAVIGTAGHNYLQAMWHGGRYTVEGRRNINQIFSAQQWTRAGFSYYKHNE